MLIILIYIRSILINNFISENYYNALFILDNLIIIICIFILNT